MMISAAMPVKDFMDKINAGKLKPSAHLFGKVKKSENKDELLFAFKAPRLNWISLPATLVEHVHLIKSFKIDDEDVSLVKLKLNEPADKNAKVFYDLLAGMSEKMMQFWEMEKTGWKGESCHSHEQEHRHECRCSHCGHHGHE